MACWLLSFLFFRRAVVVVTVATGWLTDCLLLSVALIDCCADWLCCWLTVLLIDTVDTVALIDMRREEKEDESDVNIEWAEPTLTLILLLFPSHVLSTTVSINQQQHQSVSNQQSTSYHSSSNCHYYYFCCCCCHCLHCADGVLVACVYATTFKQGGRYNNIFTWLI